MLKRTSTLLIIFTLTLLLGKSGALFAKDSCAFKKTVITIIPFEQRSSAKQKAGTPSSTSPAAITSLLLKDYLNLNPKVSTTFQQFPQALTLKGTLTTQGGQHTFQSQIVKPSGEVLFSYEGTLEFPDKINILLMDYVLKASTALGSKLKEKEILPFLNKTNSSQTYLSYAEGMTAYHQHNLLKAQQSFEMAIKNDYNYIPAYVALSQVLKDLMNPKAEVEWQKAQLLNPDLSKRIKETSFCP